MIKMRAKLLLATAHAEISDAEDVVIVRRGSGGVQCYSTMDNDKTTQLLRDMGYAFRQMPRREKFDA